MQNLFPLFPKAAPTSMSSSPTNTDAMISSALQEMSLQDRDKVYRDIHGGSLYRDENDPPEFVDIKLHELQDHLEEVVRNDRLSGITAAWKKAESTNYDHVHSRALLLSFLRVDDFDVPNAALRLVRYFDWKLFLFGEELVGKRTIDWDDLQPEDVKILKKGYLQVLPQRDKAGRAVVMWNRCYQQHPEVMSASRAFFYMMQQFDEETDRMGVVFVVFKNAHVPLVGVLNAKEIWMLVRNLRDMPYKIVAMHKCLKQKLSIVSQIMDNIVYMMDPTLKARVKLHYGSYSEWMYAIMGYGIPHHLIANKEDGKTAIKNHQEFLETRRLQEVYAKRNGASLTNSETSVTLVELPSNVDICLGRGKTIQDFMGNKRLQQLVDEHVIEYDNSNKAQKTNLASKLVQLVHDSGGRFLTKESGIWMKAPDDIARDKVSHMFRHRRNVFKKQSNNGTKEKYGQALSTPNTVTADIHLGNKTDDMYKRIKLGG